MLTGSVQNPLFQGQRKLLAHVWLLGNYLRKELGMSSKWGQEWQRGKSHHLTPFQSFPHRISSGYIRMFSQELCWACDRAQLESLMRVLGPL